MPDFRSVTAEGGRRQAAGGRWQAADGRRQAAGGRRQAAGGRRQAFRDIQRIKNGKNAKCKNKKIKNKRSVIPGNMEQCIGFGRKGVGFFTKNNIYYLFYNSP